MTTIEKPTTPSPANMAENMPSLNSGDMIAEPVETDTFDRPILGRTAMASDEYAEGQDAVPTSNEVRTWEEKMALDETVQDAKNSLVPIASNEDTHEPTPDGYITVDTTRNEEHDELPEDLKDEIGAPDDEAQNQ